MALMGFERFAFARAMYFASHAFGSDNSNSPLRVGPNGVSKQRFSLRLAAK
jgi:hypothetical protein